MADIKTRYTEGSESQYANYIGKGILIISTIAVLIFSTMPHRYCCKKSDKDKDKNPKPKYDKKTGELIEEETDEKLDILDCNCVWNSPLRIFLLSLVLFILLGTTLYLPDIVLSPAANLFEKITLAIGAIGGGLKSGFMGFISAIKKNIPKLVKTLLIFGGGIGVIAGIIYMFFNFANGMFTIVTTLLVIGALALIYKYVHGSVASKFMSLVVSVIFFLPCLLRDLFTYLHKEFKLSTPIEWSILFVELVIIALFFVIPKVYEHIMKNRGTVLLNKPVYTNEETIIQNKQIIVKNPDIPYAKPSSESINKKHDYNYGISLWLYIDARPPNTSYAYEKFTPLFSYQKMPEMLYKGSTNEFKIMMQKDLMNDKMYTIYTRKDLPLQKWNHFVINYDGGTLDIFLNNELVVSEKNVSPKIENEDVQIGSKNGVHGGICNIQYFDQVLTQREISFLYNSLKYKNIPTV